MKYHFTRQAMRRIILSALIVMLSASCAFSLNVQHTEVSTECLATATEEQIVESTPVVIEQIIVPEQSSAPVQHVETVTTYDLPLSKDLQAYTYKMCKEYGIVDSYELVLAIIWKESNFKANLISKTNDYGLMQINKVNHKRLSECLGITDFLDAKQNIEAGVYMLSGLLNKYYNEDKALMAYNLGEAGAKRYWCNGTYSNSYSTAVMLRKDLVLQNKYSEGI